MWEIKQQANNALELYIYGDVEGDGYDWWADEVIRSETSANTFRETLAQYKDVSEIKIYINSYGGSVFEGTAIYNQLKRHPAQKTVYVDGFACSIASVIAAAGDKVIMPKNALVMIHNMWMYANGNAAQLRKAADDLDTINTAGMQAYLDKAGDKLTAEQLKVMMDNETWLTAEQCMEYGLADEYAEQDADMSKANEVLQKANLGIEQRISVQKSLVAQLSQLTQPQEKQGPETPAEPTTAPETKVKQKLFFNFKEVKHD